MGKTVSIFNQKGGVGKTTTCVNFAAALGLKGKKTLLVDLDPQGNTTSGVGIDKTEIEQSTYDILINDVSAKDILIKTDFKNLSVLPANMNLAGAELELAEEENRFKALKKALAPLVMEYDYIIIDSPPSLSLLTVNGLIAANYILLPVQAEFYALEGLGQLLETMKLVRKGLNTSLELLGVLPTMMDSRTSLSGQVHEEIKKYFPDKVFENTIPRNIRLAEAPSHGLPVGAYDRFSKGARAYKALTKEIIERVGQ